MGWLLKAPSLVIPCVKSGRCSQRDAGWAGWAVRWRAWGELLRLIPKRIWRP